MKLLAALLTSLALLTTQAQAQNKAAIEKQFQSWLVQTIWPQARTKGVSSITFNAAFGDVTLNWKLPDLVLPGAKAEVPEQQR